MTEQRKIEIQPDKRARFTEFRNGQKQGEAIYVHFNPASLQLQLTNELDPKEEGGETVQYIKKSSAKLTMDLIFDTTHLNTDVRQECGRIGGFMQPAGSGGQNNTPATVLFEWGSFAFQGLIESYKETLDFFSREGLPLRASVNVTMSKQDLIFTSSEAPESAPIEVPPVEGDDITSMVSRAGNENAGREAAAANGLESMRFSDGPISLDASISLGGPVAFASGSFGIGASAGFGISGGAGIGVSGGAGFGVSGGAGFGVSGGAGIGISGGAGIGMSGGAGIGISGGAGFGVSGGAGIGVSGGASLNVSGGASFGMNAEAGITVRGPEFGGRAAAGLTASQGAFAGLRIQPLRPSGPPLDVNRLLPRAESARVGVDSGGGFRVGGRASATARLDATGPAGSLNANVRFEGE